MEQGTARLRKKERGGERKEKIRRCKGGGKGRQKEYSRRGKIRRQRGEREVRGASARGEIRRGAEEALRGDPRGAHSFGAYREIRGDRYLRRREQARR